MVLPTTTKKPSHGVVFLRSYMILFYPAALPHVTPPQMSRGVCLHVPQAVLRVCDDSPGDDLGERGASGAEGLVFPKGLRLGKGTQNDPRGR